jgi:hypothetical protein
MEHPAEVRSDDCGVRAFWRDVPTASAERFERFTAKEAENFLTTRFSIFVARGLDCTSALLLATRPEES